MGAKVFKPWMSLWSLGVLLFTWISYGQENPMCSDWLENKISEDVARILIHSKNTSLNSTGHRKVDAVSVFVQIHTQNAAQWFNALRCARVNIKAVAPEYSEAEPKVLLLVSAKPARLNKLFKNLENHHQKFIDKDWTMQLASPVERFVVTLKGEHDLESIEGLLHFYAGIELDRAYGMFFDENAPASKKTTAFVVRSHREFIEALKKAPDLEAVFAIDRAE